MKRQQPGEASKSPKGPCLLLHAVDGIFPYLTIDHLQRCFPATENPDLMIGLAVRDTCIEPLFDDEAKGSRKPRGYAFSDTVKVHPYLLPYPRVTVPTFDPVQDANTRACSSNTLSKAQIHLWTQNGRQPLSVDQYEKISEALESNFTVSLFDAIDPTRATAGSKRSYIRKGEAMEKTRFWAELRENKNNLWLPFPVEGTWEEAEEEHLQWILQQGDREEAPTVALIHWNHIDDVSARQWILDKLKDTTIAVLSTNSTDQIIQLLSTGVKVVGTNLPTQWAQAKKAFVKDISSVLRSNEVAKRPKLDCDDLSIRNLDVSGCLDLNPPTVPKEHPWFADPKPIMVGCECLTCRRHCRAYIYHLVCSKELLAEILLFVHNLHHLLCLMRAVDTDEQQ